MVTTEQFAKWMRLTDRDIRSLLAGRMVPDPWSDWEYLKEAMRFCGEWR